MMMRETLHEAREKSIAIGHFNVSNLEMLRAVCMAAKEVGVPAVMIGTSEGEREFIGLKQAVTLVKAFEDEYGIPLFLNADHSKSVESAKAAIDAGYLSVHFDGSELEYEENIRQTKEVVEYAKKSAGEKLTEVEPPSVSIEGELGYIGGGSTITQEKMIMTPEQMTDPAQAKDYVERTGVNRLAIAIGNVHGLNLEEPQLDFERLKAIREAVPESCALVLHAGSGIPDADIKKAISLGIVNIHISTELRKAYREALEQSLREHPEEYAPYKVFAPVAQAIKVIVMSKLTLFLGNENPLGLATS